MDQHNDMVSIMTGDGLDNITAIIMAIGIVWYFCYHGDRVGNYSNSYKCYYTQ